MTLEEQGKADEKIRKFEEFINGRANEINNSQQEEYDVEEINLTETNGQSKKLFYFIGRLNPPHNGHIAALRTLVELANKSNSVPLILLGSGPAQKNGDKRTMDNPISFETKKQLIVSKLPGVEGTDYIIQEMANPASDVSKYVSTQLGDVSDLQDIEITHIAGGKDEDATKLSFALKSAENTASRLAPNATVTASVEAIEPEVTDTGSAMSATKVRKDAYKTIINGNGFEEWNTKYGQFYGPMAQTIYDEILVPITKSELTPEQIQDYITNGTLPSISKKRKEVNTVITSSSSSTRQKRGTRGGSTKRKNNRNSKNRNKNKNKNKTQRRKRKTHRRKC
jgi:nicotinamide mononucleotide adenylyltransferase